MEGMRKLCKENLDITEEDVIAYLNRHRPRVILHGIVFCFQFVIVWWFVTGGNWRDKYFITVPFTLTVFIILMTFFELLRFSDFLLKKYGLLHYLGGEESGSGGRPGVRSNSDISSGSQLSPKKSSTQSSPAKPSSTQKKTK